MTVPRLLPAVLAAAVVWVGCAGSPPERTHYLLRARPVERAGAVEAPVRVDLSAVTVAPYLANDGLVLETAPGQVRRARLHQWAEPLGSAARSLLRDELARALGFDVSARGDAAAERDFAVAVHLDRLHGSMEGTALLDAGYQITGRDGQAHAYRFSTQAPLAREGYDGLVEAESQLLRALAEDIARSLEARMSSSTSNSISNSTSNSTSSREPR